MVTIDNQHDLSVIQYEYREIRRDNQEEIRPRFDIEVNIESSYIYDGVEEFYERPQLEKFNAVAERAMDELRNSPALYGFSDMTSEQLEMSKEVFKYANLLYNGNFTDLVVKRIFFKLVQQNPTLDLLENFRRFITLSIINHESRLDGISGRLAISWSEFWNLFTNQTVMIDEYWTL